MCTKRLFFKIYYLLLFTVFYGFSLTVAVGIGTLQSRQSCKQWVRSYWPSDPFTSWIMICWVLSRCQPQIYHGPIISQRSSAVFLRNSFSQRFLFLVLFNQGLLLFDMVRLLELGLDLGIASWAVTCGPPHISW